MENATKVVNYFIDNTIKILNKVSDTTNRYFKNDAEKELFAFTTRYFQEYRFYWSVCK